jgi:hypothetical protein
MKEKGGNRKNYGEMAVRMVTLTQKGHKYRRKWCEL